MYSANLEIFETTWIQPMKPFAQRKSFFEVFCSLMTKSKKQNYLCSDYSFLLKY